MAFSVPAHPGALGRLVSFAKVSLPSVTIMAMKKAEDSDETIVRVLERNGQAASGIRLNFARAALSVREVDGQEHAKAGIVGLEKGAIVFDMKAYAVRTFAVTFTLPKSAATVRPIPLPFNADANSSGVGQGDGDFDGAGRSLPGELLPPSITSGGIRFDLANSALKNAVKCEGQRIMLPAGQRLYLLAASADGTRQAKFLVDGKVHSLEIQAWNGYVGQGDTRLWEGATDDEKTAAWPHKLVGIRPGFIHEVPIAWYADHRRLPDGKDDAYRFCYLYRYSLDLPKGTKSVTLPNDPKVVIMSATVGDAPGDKAFPLHPLYAL